MAVILIADDISIVRDTLRATFGTFGQQVVITANSGEEAIQIARERDDLDLVLLDYQMSPGARGGAWAARELRRVRPDLPVVFVSAYTEPEKLADARGAGAVAYIAKDRIVEPAVFQALVTVDVEALRRAAMETEDVWFFLEGAPPPN